MWIDPANVFELEGGPRKRRVDWRKAYLISLKRSETTLGCATADRAVVEGPELASGHRDGDDISPKALGPVSGLVQCLGEMPWEGRVTAFKPDDAPIVRAHPKVNTRYCGFSR